MGLLDIFETKKTINNPRLRGFTDAGWHGFKDGARLYPSGIEPLLAELDYSEKDYVMILVTNEDDGTNNTAVQAITPYRRYHKVFDNEDIAMAYANKLVRKLTYNVDNSEDAIKYCKNEGFTPIQDEHYKP